MDNNVMNTDSVSMIILAAGSSTRMGKSKQLMLIGGKPLLRKTAEEAVNTGQNVVVVLGAGAAQHREVLKGLNLDIVMNDAWQNGMGSSLKAGMNYVLSKNPAVQAVLILVCDQPFLTSAHLKTIVDTHRASHKPIVASRYAGTLGVPCIFSRSCFPHLQTVKDDEGAKRLISLFSDVEAVDFPRGDIDLDTPEDVDKLVD